MSGLPIVGYGSGYSKDLIRNGGGLLTVVNEPSDLAELISVVADRTKLVNRVERGLWRTESDFRLGGLSASV